MPKCDKTIFVDAVCYVEIHFGVAALLIRRISL